MSNQNSNNSHQERKETAQNNAEQKPQNTVLQKIRTGEVQMRSRAYFMLKFVLLIIVGVAVLLTSSFLFSFILFSIKASGRMFLLGFGLPGLQLFFMLFPWKVLLVDAILMLILEWLVKHFQFGYRRSFIYLLSGILMISVVAGIIINATPLHNLLSRSAKERHLPSMVAPLYENVRRPSDNREFIRGTIIEFMGNELTLIPQELEQENTQDEDNVMLLKVILPPPIIRRNDFQIGDEIFVAGAVRDGQIFAFGIKKVETNLEN